MATVFKNVRHHQKVYFEFFYLGYYKISSYKKILGLCFIKMVTYDMTY